MALANIAAGIDQAAAKVARRTSEYDQDERGDYLSVEQLRKQYTDYLHVKNSEITEQRVHRHYYHGDQWTREEIQILKARKQPVVTSNRIARKIDAVVGLLERLRQDPKAYPRTPQHATGAEVVTATLRYALDNNNWDWLSNEVGRDAAIEGIGGIELDISQKERGDPDVEIRIQDPDLFFYDPRSFREDFSDCRFMGIAKWVDQDTAKELMPDKAEEIDNLVGGGGSELGADSDREKKWIDSDNKRIRLIDHWYRKNGQWRWCVYSWDVKFMEGTSPFVDENGETFPKFIMFSAAVDHDGDRYGFPRNMKSAQDEINHRRSKALFYLNTRGVTLEEGAVNDVEKLRAELARPDRVVVKNPGKVLEYDDQAKFADMQGQLKFLEQSVVEIENYGPNPALVGQGGVENSSGRAISLLQQAGIAELGPFMAGYRGWKLRVYRAVWNLIQRFWTSERWIRVTDDDGVAQFVQLNSVGLDPNGLPATVNALGALDVDIILDEGPDTLTMEADTFQSLQALGPSFAQTFPDIALELLPGVQPSVKKKMLERMKEQQSQPSPEVAQSQAQMQLRQQEAQADLQLGQQKAQSDVQITREKNAADIELKQATAVADMQLERERMLSQLELERDKMMAQIELEREKIAGQMRLKAEAQQMEFDLKQRAAATEAEQRDETADVQAA